MTGHGRAQAPHHGGRIDVELNSVNRKQSDVQVALPRELAALEPRVREVVNAQVSRGRLNVVITMQHGAAGTPALALDATLARGYYGAMLALQRELGIPGEVTIDTVLRAPGVLRAAEEELSGEGAWPALEAALGAALRELVLMREREGRHLARDLIHRLKLVRQNVRNIRDCHPAIMQRHREALRERVLRAGLEIAVDDDRLMKEVIFFADKSDITEEIIRLESHFSQVAHLLRRREPVGRTLEFISQEISREFNTIGAKANDAGISQRVVTCKAEMEKIREQIQNIE